MVYISVHVYPALYPANGHASDDDQSIEYPILNHHNMSIESDFLRMKQWHC